MKTNDQMLAEFRHRVRSAIRRGQLRGAARIEIIYLGSDMWPHRIVVPVKRRRNGAVAVEETTGALLDRYLKLIGG